MHQGSKITNVEMVVNPFNRTNEVKVNGVAVDFDCIHGRICQEWVDIIFDKIYDHINGIECLSLVFHGLSSDYDDVVEALNTSAGSRGFRIGPIEHIAIRSADERLSEIALVMHDLCNKSGIKEFQSEGCTEEFKRVLDPSFEIYVLAPMSAGKSTVINAMLGRDLLPSKNEACTATVTAINDSKEIGPDFTGRAFDVDSNCIYNSGFLIRDDVERWNYDDNVVAINIFGDVKGIKYSQYENLIFVDTPGPNNSQNTDHRKATFSAIENSGMSLILYIMNATQLGVDDDKALLERIRDEIIKGGRSARDRFIFILNKVDALDENENLKNVLGNCRKYLEGIGIQGARIFPVSAQTTKLARMRKSGMPLGRKENQHFHNECENMKYELDERLFDCSSVSNNIRSRMRRAFDEAHAAEDIETQLEIFGGIPVVEAVISEYLEKYAHVHKVVDAYDALKRRYDDVYRKQVESVEYIIDASDKELGELSRSIGEIESIVDNSDFREKIKMEIGKKKDIPESFEKEIRECRKKSQGVIMDLERSMNDKVSLSHAHSALAAARRRIDDASADLCNFLEKQFVSIQKQRMGEYKKIYDEHLFFVMSKIDDGSAMFSNMKKSLSMESFSLSYNDNLIDEYKSVIIKTSGNPDKAWYKPWTWGDDEYSVTRTEVVDLSGIYNRQILPTRERFDVIIEDAKNEVKSSSVKLKDLFENVLMPKAERAMGEYLLQLRSNLDKKVTTEARRAQAMNTKRYLEMTMNRIDVIISLQGK